MKWSPYLLPLAAVPLLAVGVWLGGRLATTEPTEFASKLASRPSADVEPTASLVPGSRTSDAESRQIRPLEGQGDTTTEVRGDSGPEAGNTSARPEPGGKKELSETGMGASADLNEATRTRFFSVSPGSGARQGVPVRVGGQAMPLIAGPEANDAAVDVKDEGNAALPIRRTVQAEPVILIQRKRPISTAEIGAPSDAEEVPVGDAVTVTSVTTVGERTAKVADAVPAGNTTEERLVDLGEKMATAPTEAKAELVKQFNTIQDEDEKLGLLIMANASNDEALARRMLTAALGIKQPRAIRLQALEFLFARNPEMAKRYVNDADEYMRFSAKSLLGLNPEPPSEGAP